MRYDAAVIKSTFLPSSPCPPPTLLGGQYAPTVFNWKNFTVNFFSSTATRAYSDAFAAVSIKRYSICEQLHNLFNSYMYIV